MGSCPPPQHPHCSSSPYTEELEVKGWEKEDFRHRSWWEGGQGGDSWGKVPRGAHAPPGDRGRH